MANVEIKVTKISKSPFTEEERKLRQEARRLVSLANKRLRRMEKQNLQNSPAYKSWVENGQAKFSVRGKSMAQVQAEVGRMNKFINMATSTVKGAKNYFITVGKNVGITKFEDIPDLQNKLNVFFEITGKVKEYLHNSKEIGVAIGYEEIWKEVSDYVQEVSGEMIDVEQAVLDVAEKLVPAATLGKADEILDSFLDGF